MYTQLETRPRRQRKPKLVEQFPLRDKTSAKFKVLQLNCMEIIAWERLFLTHFKLKRACMLYKVLMHYISIS